MSTPDELAAALGLRVPDGLTIPADPSPDRHVDVDEIRASQIRARLTAVIPPRWVDATVTNPQVSAWVDGFLAGAPDSLLLLGMVGRGKTHQAMGAIRRIVEESWPEPPSIVAGPVTDLLDALRPPCPDPREVIGRYRQAGLLVLDDLGVEDESKTFVADRLYQLVDYRYRWLRPTVVISNLTPEQLAAHVGDRLFSRLCEMCRRVVLTGPDRRRAAR